MKNYIFLTLTLSLATAGADPLLTSWFTENSGSYARIYTDNAAVTSTTTWSKGAGTQNLPMQVSMNYLLPITSCIYARLISRATPWAHGIQETSQTTLPITRQLTDANEQTDLGTPTSGRPLNAYNACIAKDAALGDVYTP